MVVINRMFVCKVQVNNRRSVFFQKGAISDGELSTFLYENCPPSYGRIVRLFMGSKKVFHSVIYFQIRRKRVIIARKYPGGCAAP